MSDVAVGKENDPKVKRGDFITYYWSIVIDHLYGLIRVSKDRYLSKRSNKKNPNKWNFCYYIYECFDKTANDIFMNF